MEVHFAEPAEPARRILLRRVGAVQPCAPTSDRFAADLATSGAGESAGAL